jgi:organic radical activating enzyme
MGFMFGNNPIRKQDLSSPSQLWIQEVFPTIQGEGPFAGQGAIFVRLGGCNLKCYWCDTDFESSTWHPHVDELINSITNAEEHCKTDLVVLTGGEPFRQDISKLVHELKGLHYRVQIETNGIAWIDGFERFLIDGRCTIVCSPKTGRVHEKIRQYASAWKYIVASGEVDEVDGLPITSTQVDGKRIRIARPPEKSEVYVQPLDSYDEAKNKGNEILAVHVVKKHGYRLSYQIHKHLGLP